MKEELIEGIYEDTLKIQQKIEEEYKHIRNIDDENRIYKELKKECENLCKKYGRLKKEDSYLQCPDTSLPFFAYGIFKYNEIAYHRIEPYVDDYYEASVHYSLYLRDGIPFISEENNEFETLGYVLKFKDNSSSKKAYDIIRKTESKSFYRWEKVKTTNDEPVNILIGRKPSKSNPQHLERGIYHGRNDIFFRDAINLIIQDILNYKKDNEYMDFLKWQRNYMLLWAAIERYTSLKYGENSKMENNRFLAEEDIFEKSLKNYVDENENRKIFNTKTLDSDILDSENPQKSIKYYYTMRSNVVHKGKSTVQIEIDEKNLKKSLIELLNIFECVLEDTFKGFKFERMKLEYIYSD